MTVSNQLRVSNVKVVISHSNKITNSRRPSSSAQETSTPIHEAAIVKKRVLVTAGRAPAALEWVRSLAQNGWTVLVGDSLRFTTAGFSRYCSSTVRLPQPRYAPQQFRQAILDAIDIHNLDLVIPTCEEVFFLSSLHPKIFCPPLDILRQLHSKWLFMNVAARFPIRVPQSSLLTNPAQFPQHPSTYVFKAEYSRFGEGTKIGSTQGILPPVVMQERLQGQELSGYGVAIQGQLKAWVSYLPVYRIAGASSVFFRPVVDSEALEFATQMVKGLDYHGQIAFDFIRTAEGLYVLECNPRATSGVHLFGSQLAKVLDGHFVQPEMRDRMLSPALALVRPIPPMQQLLNDILNAKDAIFDISDPGPIVGMAAHVVETGLLSMTKGITLKAAMTRDLEWDGEPFESL